jgi:hypothetical protein
MGRGVFGELNSWHQHLWIRWARALTIVLCSVFIIISSVGIEKSDAKPRINPRSGNISTYPQAPRKNRRRTVRKRRGRGRSKTRVRTKTRARRYSKKTKRSKRSKYKRSKSKRKSKNSAKTQVKKVDPAADLYNSIDVSTQSTTDLSPWVGLLESHPRFIQAARLQSAKGRSGDGDAHPRMYQGELKDDTCVAFNWGSAGFLKNPIELNSTDTYKTREHSKPKRGRNYGVPEMILAIKKAVEEVHDNHKDSKRLVIGDLSRFSGGFFPPHLSHQSGRDADIGYYTKGSYQPEYLQRIRAHQLDVKRTWTFLHSFLKDDKVKYIFMDYRLQKPLYYYMKDVAKLPPRLLRKYISYPRRTGGIIRHLKGHADHIHVRFYAPQSLEAGRAYLRKHGMKVVKPVPVYYRIRRGDTLIRIARRFRIKWTKLMRWNRLNRSKARRLRAGKRLIVGYRTPPLP